MKRLLLIDAYSQIYRAYYAFVKNPRVNSKGLNTGAILGFVNTLDDVLKREQPTHVAVVFDPGGKTFRHEAYEAYKAQRQATPEDIRTAVPIIKQIVEAYRIPVVQVEGYEADDVVGTLAKMADETGDFEVLMLTSDKDYGQLVTEHVFIYKPRFGGNGYDKLGVPEVLTKWDLQQVSQVIDLLGLMGDASDNIPGCPGVGEKTATKLLQEFGNIDNLLANTAQLKGALKTKIEENRDKIIFSRFLATIKTDVPVTFDETTLRREEPDKTTLTALFTELEFRAHLNKLSGTDASTKPAPKPAAQRLLFADETAENDAETAETVPLKSAADTAHNYKIVQTDAEIDDLIELLSRQTAFCFDTETTSVNVFEAELVGMSFAVEAHTAYYVPAPTSHDEICRLLQRFKPVFESENCDKIGQNLKFDIMVLQNYVIEVKGHLFDTMIAH